MENFLSGSINACIKYIILKSEGKSKSEDIWIIFDQLWGQNGQILAKFFFACYESQGP